jgi:hypothetical protein
LLKSTQISVAHILLKILPANLFVKLRVHKNAAVCMFSFAIGLIFIQSNSFFHSSGFLIIFEAALNAVHSINNDHTFSPLYTAFSDQVAHCIHFQIFTS